MPAQVFDLRQEDLLLDRGEWNPRKKRDPQAARGICLHQWGCVVGTTAKSRERWGEPEALARRALGVPAHASVGVTQHGGDPIVAICHPLERWVHGSDDANGAFLTLEVMGHFPFVESMRKPHHTLLTPALAVAVETGLQVLLDLLDQWTGRTGPWELITHRQACNSRGDHTLCPGEAPIMMAMSALRGDLGDRIKPNPDLVLDPKWGHDWPAAWRSHV